MHDEVSGARSGCLTHREERLADTIDPGIEGRGRAGAVGNVSLRRGTRTKAKEAGPHLPGPTKANEQHVIGLKVLPRLLREPMMALLAWGACYKIPSSYQIIEKGL